MRSRFLPLFVVLLSFITACSNKQNKFSVVGKIDNMPVQSVFLEELGINDIIIIDSAKTDESGKFELEGTAPEPGLYRLRFEQSQFILLSVDKGNVKVTGNWNDLEAY